MSGKIIPLAWHLTREVAERVESLRVGLAITRQIDSVVAAMHRGAISRGEAEAKLRQMANSLGITLDTVPATSPGVRLRLVVDNTVRP